MSCSPTAVAIMPWKKSPAADRAARPSTDHREARIERGQHRRQVGRRIGVRDVAADRAAIAHRGIADMSGRLGQRRHSLAHQRDEASSACVVRAPIRSEPPTTAMPFSSAMRPMSTSADGAVRRSLSSGIRLWPPARILAPGCCRSSSQRFARRSPRGSSSNGTGRHTCCRRRSVACCIARHTRSGVIGIFRLSTPSGASASITAL